MSTRCLLILCLLYLTVAPSVCAQGTIDKNPVRYPTEEEVAANKRLWDMLRHPTFITLRLTSNRRYVPREEPSDSPSPYTVGDWINFQLLVTQSSSETLDLSNTMSPYYEFCPALVRDGDIVPYTKTAQERFDRAEREPWNTSTRPAHLVPGREDVWINVETEDWYEPLPPGHYQLSVRKRFVSDGDWLQTNPVVFDVRPRTPAAPIPNGVRIRLAPQGAQQQAEGRPYRLGNEDYLDVLVVNDSDQRVKVSVVDSYYGNRFQLFKEGKLIPYSEETAKLIASKDASPRLVDVVEVFFIDPKITHPLDAVKLRNWYGTLAPGVYRLVNRRRFEIDGPWTDSAELLFEVVR